MEVIKQTSTFLPSSHAVEATAVCNSCGCSFFPTTSGKNLCLKCTTTQTDITEGLSRQVILNYCHLCKRYYSHSWTSAELESKELLSICLKKIKGLNKVKLVDACFVWTEPTSRRIKVRVTVQKEIMKNINLQQSFQVEYMIHHLQCLDCKKQYSNGSWGSLVQVRERRNNKKILLYLEQLILKYNIHDKALRIKETSEGVDFFYNTKTNAHRLVEFLQSMFCVRIKHFKQPTYQNAVKNQVNYRYVYTIDLPKLFRDDLVILSPKVAEVLGNCSRILLCLKVTNTILFVDPANMKTIEMTSSQYFQYESEMSFVSPKENMAEFSVLRKNNIGDTNRNSNIVRIMVKKLSNEEKFDVKTHLGNVLQEGNLVLGYDLTTINFDGILDNLSVLNNLPDVVLFRMNPKATVNSERIWKLKHLEEKSFTNGDQDYTDFLNDLETSPEMRAHMNLYRNEKAINEKRDEGEDSKKQKKLGRRKLKIIRTGKGPLVVAGGDEQDDDDNDDKKGDIEEEKKVKNKEKKTNDMQEDDPMVKIEELLADLSLEDSETEENDEDAIDEFIKRLEKVKIEGKE